MLKQKITISEKVLQQNPLFWSKQGNLIVEWEKKNIFLGIGVANPFKLSQAVPFDELGFVLSAEFLKRQIPQSKVFCLIADQHAWLANKMNHQESLIIAQRQLETITRVVKTLKLNNWHTFLASLLFPKTQPSSYEKLEKRDVNFFFKNHNTGIKLGWKFSNSEKFHKTDEQHFDSNFKKIKSIFIKPGRTLDINKSQESPYICSCPLERIILSADEKVASKLALAESKIPQNQIEAARNQLKRITLVFEKIIQALPAKTPIEIKTQMIIDKIFS